MEDLKKIVVEALDKNGSLDVIRAQLRSSVFSAIQSEQKKAVKTEANKAMETELGQFSAEFIREFLEKSEAVHTLHVFSLESQIQSDTKSKLIKKFQIPSDPTPAIFKLIKDFKSKYVVQELPRKEEIKKPENFREDRKEEDNIDSYSEDFEEIEEDIEAQSIETGGKESQRYFESVGSSGGVDPSVDSMALDQCDYLEAVKRPRN